MVKNKNLFTNSDQADMLEYIRKNESRDILINKIDFII